MSEVLFDIPRRRLTVDRWSVRPVWIRRSGPSGSTVSALVVVRGGVHLLITTEKNRSEALRVELWAKEPDDSDELAVVRRGDALAGIANIPLCVCGERGCGNNGLQLAAEVQASDLPTLVDLLHSLPNVPGPPNPDLTWRGDFSEGNPAI